MKLTKLIIITFFIFFGSNINAQIVTERPTQSESSSVIPKGSFQIETGVIYERQNSDFYSFNSLTAPVTLLRFGLTKSIELRLLSQYQKTILEFEDYYSENSGIDNFEIGTKVQIFKKEASKTEIAFLTYLSIPTVSNPYSTVASINKFAFSHKLANNLGIGYNIGIKFQNHSSVLIYSLALGYNVNDKLGFFIEPYGHYALNRNLFSSHSLNTSVNGGVYYQLKDNFQVDFSFGTSINHHMNFLAMGFGWLISPDKD